MPDSALAPVAAVIAREALKESAIGAGTLGKAIPFGIGAVLGRCRQLPLRSRGGQGGTHCLPRAADRLPGVAHRRRELERQPANLPVPGRCVHGGQLDRGLWTDMRPGRSRSDDASSLRAAPDARA